MAQALRFKLDDWMHSVGRRLWDVPDERSQRDLQHAIQRHAADAASAGSNGELMVQLGRLMEAAVALGEVHGLSRAQLDAQLRYESRQHTGVRAGARQLRASMWRVAREGSQRIETELRARAFAPALRLPAATSATPMAARDAWRTPEASMPASASPAQSTIAATRAVATSARSVPPEAARSAARSREPNAVTPPAATPRGRILDAIARTPLLATPRDRLREAMATGTRRLFPTASGFSSATLTRLTAHGPRWKIDAALGRKMQPLTPAADRGTGGWVASSLDAFRNQAYATTTRFSLHARLPALGAARSLRRRWRRPHTISVDVVHSSQAQAHVLAPRTWLQPSTRAEIARWVVATTSRLVFQRIVAPYLMRMGPVRKVAPVAKVMWMVGRAAYPSLAPRMSLGLRLAARNPGRGV